MTRLEKLEQKIKELERKLCCKTQFFDTFDDFHEEGATGVLYIDEETGDIYIWDGVAYVTADGSADDMLVSKTIYVDATYGDDTTGSRENANLPFLTIAAAVTAASDGDTLHVYPGDYTTGSISTTKALHIYCEDGVTWTYTGAFMGTVTNPQKLKWRFDVLKNNTINVAVYFTTAKNFEVDLHINYAFGIFMIVGGLASTVRNHDIFVDTCENSFIRADTYLSTDLAPSSNIKINTLISYSFPTNTIAFVNATNSIASVNIENIQYGGSLLSSQLVGTASSTSDGTTTGYKSYSTNITNITATTTVALPAHNNVFDAALVWIGVAANLPYGQIWRDLLNNSYSTYNLTIKNALSYRHGVLLLGSPQSDTNIKATYNISGVWYRGIPIYTGYLSTFINSVITINLDVVVEDSTGIYFGAYDIGNALNDINATNTVIVTGRIKTKKAGFPCITIQGNTNNAIVLKDLTLINDGTVSPIMTNYAPGNNINIQNVVTNSLITDPLITEVGQPIVRNINYK